MGVILGFINIILRQINQQCEKQYKNKPKLYPYLSYQTLSSSFKSSILKIKIKIKFKIKTAYE